VTPDNHDLLVDQLADTGELVLRRAVEPSASPYDELWYAWDEADEQAALAYEAWRLDPGRMAYAVYRAAQDRADTAQDALARCARAVMGPT